MSEAFVIIALSIGSILSRQNSCRMKFVGAIQNAVTSMIQYLVLIAKYLVVALC